MNIARSMAEATGIADTDAAWFYNMKAHSHWKDPAAARRERTAPSFSNTESPKNDFDLSIGRYKKNRLPGDRILSDVGFVGNNYKEESEVSARLTREHK